MTSRDELLSLRDAVEDTLGFGFEEDRLVQLGETVQSRIAQLGLTSVAAYVKHLESDEHRQQETPILAELITVTETFFYRNFEQIQAMLEIALPPLGREGKRLRVLSAGCASGEEPYSVAIALRETLPDFEAWDIKILGIDVNPAMLRKAELATYSGWALRATPERIRKRYFKAVGSDYLLSNDVRMNVTLRSGNLARNSDWAPEGFQADIIFCRNVLMYFSPEIMQQTVRRLTGLLCPGGHLFLGHAETLRGLTQDYLLCHTHSTFYYQKKDSALGHVPTFKAALQAPKLETLPRAVAGTNSWFEAIQQASDRVATLTANRPKLRTVSEPSASKPPAPPLGEVVELIQREQFTDALSVLYGLSPEAGGHPDALLLKAVLLTNQNKIDEAEVICERLLEQGDLDAGAHYLKALCREHAGDVAGAAQHDRISAHLDPTFSMPRLHAGLMAKRLKDHVSARRELTLARVLLERDELSRLVLFGGGFSRATLVALCSRELDQLGGEA